MPYLNHQAHRFFWSKKYQYCDRDGDQNIGERHSPLGRSMSKKQAVDKIVCLIDRHWVLETTNNHLIPLELLVPVSTTPASIQCLRHQGALWPRALRHIFFADPSPSDAGFFQGNWKTFSPFAVDDFRKVSSNQLETNNQILCKQI